MAEARSNNMVLRTVYLPLEVDLRLREIAFTRRVSKGELIRELIDKGLADIKASGETTLAERLDARAAGIARGEAPQPWHGRPVSNVRAEGFVSNFPSPAEPAEFIGHLGKFTPTRRSDGVVVYNTMMIGDPVVPNGEFRELSIKSGDTKVSAPYGTVAPAMTVGATPKPTRAKRATAQDKPKSGEA